jgi:hypothetical protein
MSDQPYVRSTLCWVNLMSGQPYDGSAFGLVDLLSGQPYVGSTLCWVNLMLGQPYYSFGILILRCGYLPYVEVDLMSLAPGLFLCHSSLGQTFG